MSRPSLPLLPLTPARPLRARRPRPALAIGLLAFAATPGEADAPAQRA